MCVEAKKYLCRGGICLWRGQGDGEMTTEIMSLWNPRNGWKCLPCGCLPESWKSSGCCQFPDYSITNSMQIQQIWDGPFSWRLMSSWSHIANIHYSYDMETNTKWGGGNAQSIPLELEKRKPAFRKMQGIWVFYKVCSLFFVWSIT